MGTQGFGEVAEQLRRSTVHIGGSGSGVIWRADGLIVTNAHVVHHDQVAVVLWDGRRFTGDVTKRDSGRDLATVKIAANELPAVAAGNSGALRAGELVVAVGNPMGFIGALTTGVVHAVGPFHGLGRRTYVQAAVQLAPGNSGGPLADAQGRVIGINTMIVSGGLALAIPSNTVAEFLVREPPVLLGVVAKLVQLRRGVGFRILEVSPRGPAEAASLRPNDILIGANGRRFDTMNDLSDTIEETRGILRLRFLRGSLRLQREVSVQLVRAGAEAA